jgi:hypothetical protein
MPATYSPEAARVVVAVLLLPLLLLVIVVEVAAGVARALLQLLSPTALCHHHCHPLPLACPLHTVRVLARGTLAAAFQTFLAVRYTPLDILYDM